MASIKGNLQTKYAFSLLRHSQVDAFDSKPRTFELTDDEVAEAAQLASALKAVKSKSNTHPSRKELLAALTMLITEGDAT